MLFNSFRRFFLSPTSRSSSSSVVGSFFPATGVVGFLSSVFLSFLLLVLVLLLPLIPPKHMLFANAATYTCTSQTLTFSNPALGDVTFDSISSCTLQITGGTASLITFSGSVQNSDVTISSLNCGSSSSAKDCIQLTGSVTSSTISINQVVRTISSLYNANGQTHRLIYFASWVSSSTITVADCQLTGNANYKPKYGGFYYGTNNIEIYLVEFSGGNVDFTRITITRTKIHSMTLTSGWQVHDIFARILHVPSGGTLRNCPEFTMTSCSISFVTANSPDYAAGACLAYFTNGITASGSTAVFTFSSNAISSSTFKGKNGVAVRGLQLVNGATGFKTFLVEGNVVSDISNISSATGSAYVHVVSFAGTVSGTGALDSALQFVSNTMDRDTVSLGYFSAGTIYFYPFDIATTISSFALFTINATSVQTASLTASSGNVKAYLAYFTSSVTFVGASSSGGFVFAATNKFKSSAISAKHTASLIGVHFVGAISNAARIYIYSLDMRSNSVTSTATFSSWLTPRFYGFLFSGSVAMVYGRELSIISVLVSGSISYKTTAVTSYGARVAEFQGILSAVTKLLVWSNSLDVTSTSETTSLARLLDFSGSTVLGSSASVKTLEVVGNSLRGSYSSTSSNNIHFVYVAGASSGVTNFVIGRSESGYGNIVAISSASSSANSVFVRGFLQAQAFSNVFLFSLVSLALSVSASASSSGSTATVELLKLANPVTGTGAVGTKFVVDACSITGSASASGTVSTLVLSQTYSSSSSASFSGFDEILLTNLKIGSSSSSAYTVTSGTNTRIRLVNIAGSSVTKVQLTGTSNSTFLFANSDAYLTTTSSAFTEIEALYLPQLLSTSNFTVQSVNQHTTTTAASYASFFTARLVGSITLVHDKSFTITKSKLSGSLSFGGTSPSVPYGARILHNLPSAPDIKTLTISHCALDFSSYLTSGTSVNLVPSIVNFESAISSGLIEVIIDNNVIFGSNYAAGTSAGAQVVICYIASSSAISNLQSFRVTDNAISSSSVTSNLRTEIFLVYAKSSISGTASAGDVISIISNRIISPSPSTDAGYFGAESVCLGALWVASGFSVSAFETSIIDNVINAKASTTNDNPLTASTSSAQLLCGNQQWKTRTITKSRTPGKTLTRSITFSRTLSKTQSFTLFSRSKTHSLSRTFSNSLTHTVSISPISVTKSFTLTRTSSKSLSRSVTVTPISLTRSRTASPSPPKTDSRSHPISESVSPSARTGTRTEAPPAPSPTDAPVPVGLIVGATIGGIAGVGIIAASVIFWPQIAAALSACFAAFLVWKKQFERKVREKKEFEAKQKHYDAAVAAVKDNLLENGLMEILHSQAHIIGLYTALGGLLRKLTPEKFVPPSGTPASIPIGPSSLQAATAAAAAAAGSSSSATNASSSSQEMKVIIPPPNNNSNDDDGDDSDDDNNNNASSSSSSHHYSWTKLSFWTNILAVAQTALPSSLSLLVTSAKEVQLAVNEEQVKQNRLDERKKRCEEIIQKCDALESNYGHYFDQLGASPIVAAAAAAANPVPIGASSGSSSSLGNFKVMSLFEHREPLALEQLSQIIASLKSLELYKAAEKAIADDDDDAPTLRKPQPGKKHVALLHHVHDAKSEYEKSVKLLDEEEYTASRSAIANSLYFTVCALTTLTYHTMAHSNPKSIYQLCRRRDRVKAALTDYSCAAALMEALVDSKRKEKMQEEKDKNNNNNNNNNSKKEKKSKAMRGVLLDLLEEYKRVIPEGEYVAESTVKISSASNSASANNIPLLGSASPVTPALEKPNASAAASAAAGGLGAAGGGGKKKKNNDNKNNNSALEFDFEEGGEEQDPLDQLFAPRKQQDNKKKKQQQKEPFYQQEEEEERDDEEVPPLDDEEVLPPKKQKKPQQPSNQKEEQKEEVDAKEQSQDQTGFFASWFGGGLGGIHDPAPEQEDNNYNNKKKKKEEEKEEEEKKDEEEEKKEEAEKKEEDDDQNSHHHKKKKKHHKRKH